MCSATQYGFLVRRSKAEVVETLGRRSLIGPGKPYWKTPVGFTGGTISFRSGVGRGVGTGGEGDAGVGTVRVERVAVGDSLCWDRNVRIAAVAAEPAAAETAAMMAKLVFDMLNTFTYDRRRRRKQIQAG